MGNKSPDIQYAGSPIQDKMLGLIMPGFEKMFGGGGGTPTQQNLWDVPKYDVPGHEKISPYNVNQYATQNYQVPSIYGTSGKQSQGNPWANGMPNMATSGQLGQASGIPAQSPGMAGMSGKSGGTSMPGISAQSPGVSSLGSGKGGGTSMPGTAGQGSLMPNAGWYSNLDPNIKQGLMEPTNEAAREMLNTMGGQGQMSARGGYSGGAQTALADLYSRGSQQAGMNAWNMISPIQQMEWQAKLGANQYGAEMGNQANRDVWGAQTGATQQAWGQNNMMNNADWQARLGANQYGAQGQLQQNMMPWSTMSNLWGGSIPNPVVSPGSGQNFMNNVGSPGIMGLLYGLSRMF